MESPRRMRGWLLLIGSGMALIAASVSARILVQSPGNQAPGQLIPRQPSLRWRSPEPAVWNQSRSAVPAIEVDNAGDTPVRILSLETTCGCATARVEPSLVPPRGRAAVIVEASPFEVGVRAATITLRTDSSVSPDIRLPVVLEGYREPPYVFQLTCELYYRAGYTMDDVRELTVETIEPAGAPKISPRPATDLPFLRFGSPTISDGPFLAGPTIIVRQYRFPVGFASAPPSRGFDGEVSVPDPWAAGRVLRRNVHGEPNLPIRAAPSRLVLYLDGADDGRSRVQFLARTTPGGRPLRAEAEGGESSPLTVEAVGHPRGDDYTTFEVRWRAGHPATEGLYRVIILTEAPSMESLAVPVLVRRREV